MTDIPTTDNPTDPRRCGFVALIGAPNSGKSTLTNALVGAKVSIVTHKAQTTRGPVRGIVLAGDAQVILVDTPGIFQPKRRLDRAMSQAAWDRAGDADMVALVVDAARGEQATAHLEQVTPDESAGPVPAESADVLALAVSVPCLRHELVEHRLVLRRHTGANRRCVGLGDVEQLRGVDQRRELQVRRLRQRGAVDVVARDGAPLVQLEPRVDSGVCVGIQ